MIAIECDKCHTNIKGNFDNMFDVMWNMFDEEDSHQLCDKCQGKKQSILKNWFKK